MHNTSMTQKWGWMARSLWSHVKSHANVDRGWWNSLWHILHFQWYVPECRIQDVGCLQCPAGVVFGQGSLQISCDMKSRLVWTSHGLFSSSSYIAVTLSNPEFDWRTFIVQWTIFQWSLFYQCLILDSTLACHADLSWNVVVRSGHLFQQWLSTLLPSLVSTLSWLILNRLEVPGFGSLLWALQSQVSVVCIHK